MTFDEEGVLVLRVQAGDRAALELLLDRIASPLVRYLSSLTRDAALAEDLSQEVMVTIFRKIQFLDDVRAFRAWMYRIATRLAKRRMSRKQMHEPVEELELAAASNVEGPDPWLVQQLPEALDQLSPLSRAVIVLHYVEEMSIAQAADVLEISTGTAKSRLAYGLTQLRKHFNQRRN